MKKLAFLSCFMLLIYGLTAQINLEHEFLAYGHGTFPFVLEDQVIYAQASSDSNTVKLYNGDYSFYKKIVFTLDEWDELYYRIYLLSQHLFNDDNLIEFIAIYYDDSEMQWAMGLYNENGEMLYDFGNRFYTSLIKTPDEGYKLIASNNYLNHETMVYEYYDDVYSLPGSLPNSVQSGNRIQSNFFAYPNPASKSIILNYHATEGANCLLKIFNSRGQLFENIETHSSQTQTQLDVSAYPSGMYFYEINGVTNKFVVN